MDKLQEIKNKLSFENDLYEIITFKDLEWLIDQVENSKGNNMSLEDKSKLVLKLTQEIVNEAKSREDNIGGAMRTFGNEYVVRMTTFSNFFKGI